MLARLTHLILRRRIATIATAVAFVALSSMGITRLAFKNDYRMFFSEQNPELLAFEALQKTFTRADNVLLAISAKDGSDVLGRASLTAVEALTQEAWRLPGATRVDSVTNFQNSYAQGDDIVVEDMARNVKAMPEERVNSLRRQILSEPLLVGALVDKSGKMTGINVMFEFDEADKDAAVLRVAEAARELMTRAERQYPALAFHVTGGIMLDAAFTDSAAHDTMVLIPAMLLVAVGLTGYLIGSLWAALVTVGVIAGSTLCALGCAGWLGIPLSPSSLAAPTILMTMAVADAVHFLIGYYRRVRESGDRVQSMAQSMVDHAPAVLFTSTATIASFLTMNFSDAPPFRDLGNITALGVAAAFFLSFTLLPACITFLPANPNLRRFDLLLGFLGRLHRRIARSPHAFAAAGAAACVILTGLAFLNRLDDRYVEYFGNSLAFRQHTDYVDQRLTGVYSIDYPLRSAGDNGVNDPAFLHKVEEFSQWLRSQPEVTHVHSVVDIVKKLNKNMHGDDPQWYAVPQTRELVAQCLLTYELSLPQGVNLVDRIDVGRSSLRLTASLRNVSSQQALQLEKRAQAWMAGHLPQTMRVAGTGAALMFANIGQRNILSMIWGELLGMAMVSLLMILYMRSFGLGLLSMIPNLLPAGVALGVWYLLVGEIGLTSSVVAAMTLGILTDDTVHLLSAYAKHRHELSPRDALSHAFQEAGPAIWVTSLVLISGFAILGLSSFRLNGDLGILTVIILSLGLAGDFVLLPAVLLSWAVPRYPVPAPARTVSMEGSSQ